MCAFLYDSWFYSTSMALLQTHGVSRPGVADSQSLWIWNARLTSDTRKVCGDDLGEQGTESAWTAYIVFLHQIPMVLWFIILESPEWTVLKYWKRIFLPSWKWKMGSWKMTLVSSGGPLFTSTFFFEKKRVYTSKIIWLYVYMFQVPGPFPHPPCHYKRYTTSFRWFSPPRWMTLIKGALDGPNPKMAEKNTNKRMVPPKCQCSFFSCSFFLEWDYYGHTEAVNDFSVGMKSVKLCPKFDPEAQFLLGGVISKDIQ